MTEEINLDLIEHELLKAIAYIKQGRGYDCADAVNKAMNELGYEVVPIKEKRR